jgi:hypothetical protein
LPTRRNLDTMQKTPLQGPGGFGGYASAVISSGVAVGTIKNAQGQDSAAFWNEQGQYFSLPGPLPSYARAINEDWTATGYSSNCPGPAGQARTQAMRWWITQGRAVCLEEAPVGFRIDASRGVGGRPLQPRLGPSHPGVVSGQRGDVGRRRDDDELRAAAAEHLG